MKKEMKNYMNMNKSTKLAILCIVGAFILSYIIPSFLYNRENERVAFITTKKIEKGEQITEDNLKKVVITTNDLPKSFFSNKENIIGKYAICDINSNDIINLENISNNQEIITEFSFERGQQAISITLKSLSKGFSNNLKVGDIVSIIVPDKELEEVYIPQELKYLEIIGVTTSKGADSSGENGEDLFETVTLKVYDKQAEFIALLEESKDVHFSLINRDNEKVKENLLEEQRKILGIEKTKENKNND